MAKAQKTLIGKRLTKKIKWKQNRNYLEVKDNLFFDVICRDILIKN